MIIRSSLQPAQGHSLRRAISPSKARFAGAEFTPVLWSLPLNDGYLNTHFFPNKLTEVKKRVTENKWATILLQHQV